MSVAQPQPNGQFRVRQHISRSVQTQEEAARLDGLLQSAVADALRRYDRGDRQCIAIDDTTIDRFLQYLETDRGNDPKTLQKYRTTLGRLAARFPGRPLETIASEEVKAWIQSRLKDKGIRRRYNPGPTLSRDTVNIEIKALRAFCRWAISEHLAPAGLEILAVSPLRIKGKIPGNRYPPRALPMKALLNILSRIGHAAPQLELVLRGMLLLGARPGALCEMRRRHVRLPTKTTPGMVEIPPLKGGAESAIPIHPNSEIEKLFKEAFRLFRHLHGRQRHDYPAFPSRWGRSARNPYGWTSDSFAHAVATVCRRLEIPPETFTPYTVRHSAVTFLQNTKEVSAAGVQAYAKHAQVTTQEAYSHRTGRDGEAAYNETERALRENKYGVINNLMAFIASPRKEAEGGLSGGK
jgi:integrase